MERRTFFKLLGCLPFLTKIPEWEGYYYSWSANWTNNPNLTSCPYTVDGGKTYLNGKMLNKENCPGLFEAQEGDNGYIMAFKTDEDGKFLLDGNDLVEEKIFGHVVVTYPDGFIHTELFIPSDPLLCRKNPFK